MGDPAGEDDSVHRVNQRQHHANPLCDLIDLGIIDQCGMLVSSFNPGFDFPDICCSQMGLQPAGAADLLQHGCFVVQAGIAQVHHMEQRRSTRTFWSKRTIVIAFRIHHLTMLVGADGDAASQVSHDHVHFLIGLAQRGCILSGHGLGVQHMAHIVPLEFGKSGDPCHLAKFITGDGVVDHVRDPQGLCQLVGNHRRQIGRMSGSRPFQVLEHFIVDQIGPGLYWRKNAAPGHDGGQAFQIDSLFFQDLSHSLFPIRQLVQNVRKGRKFFCAMYDGF